MNILAIVAVALTAPAGPDSMLTEAAACFAPALPQINAAQTREDSLALAEVFQQTPPGGEQSCGELLVGYLIGMTSTPAEDSWRERMRAVELLEGALRSYSDEPRIFLAMGMLLYNRQARTDADRNFARALDRRDQGEVPLTAREVAIIHYTRGLMHQDFWRDWRSFGQLSETATGQFQCGRSEEVERDNFTSSSNDMRWLIWLNQLCPDVFAENMQEFFDHRADMKQDEFVALEEAFTLAIETDPTLFAPVEALLGEYVYLEMWEKAELLVRALEERNPQDYRILLYLGLMLHETGRDSLAGPTFGRAFLTMPDHLAARFQDISLLLQPQQQEWFQGIDSLVRRSAMTAYWNSLDPLYLTAANERKLEHYARIVAADLMFASPALRERGYDSFAGEIWIRYGRPQSIWELQYPAGRVVFWDIGDGPDITFTRGSAYRSYRVADEGREYANALQRSTPQTYDVKSVVDSVEPLDHQLVRLLDVEGHPQLLVHAEWPERFHEDAVAGLTLMDQQFLPVAQWRGGKPEQEGLSVELQRVPWGTYSITVEIWDRATKQVSRVRDTVSMLAIDDSSFVVSDVLFSAGVRALGDEDEVTSRRDLELTPLYGGVLPPDQPLGLYWEIYRLSGDRGGRARYRVSLQVLDDTRRPMLARALSGIGIGRERAPASRIEYESDRPLINGRAVEWLELTSNLRMGEYRVVLTLTDRETGREVIRERPLVVRY